MPDLDAVRICLLLLLEVGFSGRQPQLLVASSLLRLVEDLDSWNRYPWGSYLWALTHPQLKTALPRRQHHVGVKADRIAKYTLTGFIFPFKIWIFETFPVARMFASRSDAIPRAIAWQWTQTIMWDMCMTFLDVDDDGRQPLMVTSTEVERETDWWRDSRRFFDSITDDFQPPTKRGRSYSPPRPPLPPPQLPRPVPLSIWSSSGAGASSPEAATTVPTPLEQRVVALEQAVRDLQAGQRALEAGQRDLEAGQRATQAGQRAILESMARLHETVQRALETNHRAKVRSKDNDPLT
ncbi:hypothetical protein L6452_38306 [Arctium lappa]|uniref:Uncharacterized protein n=1 Tax=Arctium lappa TaxID=4217 RepID=A0ACB8Y4Q7_ARCLA|nr:hypothetical protein L6452_38306 [Arctium lappa]